MNLFMHWLDFHPAFWPFFIFCARIVDVSIGTLRTICVVRGLRATAPILGFFEVLIWVTAISGVFRHLDHWYNIIAYAAGFAAGNIVGIFIEEKLAIGLQAIRFFSASRSAAVAAGLRLAGYAVTEIKGRGQSGEVSIAYVVVPRRETPTTIRVAQTIDSDVLTTVEDVRSSNLNIYRGYVPPTGWRAILKRK